MNDDIKSDIWVIGFNNEQGSYGIGLFLKKMYACHLCVHDLRVQRQLSWNVFFFSDFFVKSFCSTAWPPSQQWTEDVKKMWLIGVLNRPVHAWNETTCPQFSPLMCHLRRTSGRKNEIVFKEHQKCQKKIQLDFKQNFQDLFFYFKK